MGIYSTHMFQEKLENQTNIEIAKLYLLDAPQFVPNPNKSKQMLETCKNTQHIIVEIQVFMGFAICLLPIAHCLLPTAYWLLPIGYLGFDWQAFHTLQVPGTWLMACA